MQKLLLEEGNHRRGDWEGGGNEVIAVLNSWNFFLYLERKCGGRGKSQCAAPLCRNPEVSVTEGVSCEPMIYLLVI